MAVLAHFAETNALVLAIAGAWLLLAQLADYIGSRFPRAPR